MTDIDNKINKKVKLIEQIFIVSKTAICKRKLLSRISPQISSVGFKGFFPHY